MTVWFPFVRQEGLPASLTAAFDDVEREIRAASHRVRAELRTARFATINGWPVDIEVREAIEDATIAQLAFWAETGDSTGATAQNGGGSILSVSLPGGGGSTAVGAKAEARIAPAVAEILRNCPGITWQVGY